MLFVFLSGAMVANACSRLMVDGQDGKYYTARSLDWFEDPETNMWAFPAGMKKDGGLGAGSIEWESKYGSVVASGYDLVSVEAMNTEGLVANLLYLTETDTGADKRPGQPKLSIGIWVNFIVDQFATVAEAVDYLKNDSIAVHVPPLPMGKLPSLHVSISDVTGDSAVIEFLEGKQFIHHSREYTVMTNSPRFEEQLAIAGYWELIGGLRFLPGTHTAADRFVRLNYNVNAVPAFKDRELSLASTLSLIRHISVPYGITDPVFPNLASTYSRQIYDHTERIFFFDNALSPSVFWINLNYLDLSKGSGVRKMVYLGRWLAGEVSDQFIPSEPFEILNYEHSKPGYDLPEYGVPKPACIFKNRRLAKADVVSRSREQSAFFCNEKCFNDGADAFIYEPPVKEPVTKKCSCLDFVMDGKGKPKNKLAVLEGKVIGRTNEYFSDAHCAGEKL